MKKFYLFLLILLVLMGSLIFLNLSVDKDPSPKEKKILELSYLY